MSVQVHVPSLHVHMEARARFTAAFFLLLSALRQSLTEVGAHHFVLDVFWDLPFLKFLM